MSVYPSSGSLIKRTLNYRLDFRLLINAAVVGNSNCFQRVREIFLALIFAIVRQGMLLSSLLARNHLSLLRILQNQWRITKDHWRVRQSRRVHPQWLRILKVSLRIDGARPRLLKEEPERRQLQLLLLRLMLLLLLLLLFLGGAARSCETTAKEVATFDLLWRPKYETCRRNETAMKMQPPFFFYCY